MGKVIVDVDVSGAGLYSLNGEGADSMMVVGEKPWHYSYNKEMIRLHEKGTKITAQAVNKAAGLDWEVGVYSKEQLEAERDFRLPQTRPTDRFVLREDTDLLLGYVKEGYTEFQNAVAPVFLDSLVDSDEAFFETAGSLYAGGRCWWLMKLPEDILIAGKERTETYLLLMTSHDGSVAITVAVTCVRVVCKNTLAYGLRNAVREWRIRHTKNAPLKVSEARKALEIGFKYRDELANTIDQMLDVSFTDKQFQAFLDSLKPLPEPRMKQTADGWKQTNLPAITMAKKVRDSITEVYNQHPSQLEVKDTLWGGVQAFQFYSDHLTPKKNPEVHFRKTMLGKNDLGKKAFAHALTLVKS